MLDVSIPLIGSAVVVLPVVAKEPPEAAFSPLGALLLETVLIRIIETNVVGPMSVTGSILLKAVCISASIVWTLGTAMETVQEPCKIWSTLGDIVVCARESVQ